MDEICVEQIARCIIERERFKCYGSCGCVYKKMGRTTQEVAEFVGTSKLYCHLR